MSTNTNTTVDHSLETHTNVTSALSTAVTKLESFEI